MIMDEGLSNICIKSRGGYGGGSGGNNGGSGGGTKCGRWNPTAEQIKLLTDLFRSGLRTPSTDQIQKISTQLSFYGKIESKNVFYWFQNHKARERQKRRRVTPVTVVDEHKENHCDDKNEMSSISPYVKEVNELPEAEKVKETLQLFPLNSFNELVLFTNDQRKHIPSFPYNNIIQSNNDEMNPTLDLRLSFS